MSIKEFLEFTEQSTDEKTNVLQNEKSNVEDSVHRQILGATERVVEG